LLLAFAGKAYLGTVQMGGQMNSLSAVPDSSATAASTSITVAGVVLNASSGLPVARALVRLNDRAMLTDHEGKFEFAQFTSAGSATLQVNKPGYYAGSEAETALNTVLRADQMATPLTVRLYPEGLLTGTLTSSDGTPLPQVMVTAQRGVYSETGHQWMPVGNNMTNSRGEFRLAVPPGDYRIETGFSPRMRTASKVIMPLTVPPISSSSTSDNVHLRPGTEQRFELHPVVAPTYPVSLRVEPSMERGFPMLTAKLSDGTTMQLNVGRNGPEGETRVDLPTGSFTLVAVRNTGDALEYAETSVTVANHPVTGVVLRLMTVSPISVEVVQDADATSDKALPVPQQLGLMIVPTLDQAARRGMASLGLIASREHGSYFNAAPGSYRLIARNSGQWFVKSATYGSTDLLQQDLTIAPGGGSSPIVVTVSNQTGSLHGTTTLHGSPGVAWLYLIPVGPSAATVYMARSGNDGTFNFPYLPPGSYQAISFEGRHSADYHDPNALAAYSTYFRSVTVRVGDKASVDVDTVPSTEMVP